MAIRFRKSIQIVPGLKLNLNKKSVGFTIGGKGAHYTVNSSGRRTTSVGIPGTGISYSKSSNSKSNSKKVKRESSAKKVIDHPKSNTNYQKTPPARVQKSGWDTLRSFLRVLAFFLCGFGVLIVCVGLSLFYEKQFGGGIVAIISSFIFIAPGIFLFRTAKKLHAKIGPEYVLQTPLTDLVNKDDNPILESSLALTSAEYSYEQELLHSLTEAETINDVMDTHFAYNNLIEFYYQHRQMSVELFNNAIFYCQKDVNLFSTLKPLFLSDLHMIPRLPAFQRLVMLYEQRGEYEKAVEICSLGIKYGLADGTQGGFSARRERIEKKLIESQNT